jgi:hypothetical protein
MASPYCLSEARLGQTAPTMPPGERATSLTGRACAGRGSQGKGWACCVLLSVAWRTSICAWPFGMGAQPERMNCPSIRLSLVSLRSPSKTLLATASWLSSELVYVLLACAAEGVGVRGGRGTGRAWESG